MKLVSFTVSDRASYGVVTDNGIIDIGRGLGDRFPTLRSAMEGGALEAISREAAAAKPDLALSEVSLLPPIPNPDRKRI